MHNPCRSRGGHEKTTSPSCLRYNLSMPTESFGRIRRSYPSTPAKQSDHGEILQRRFFLKITAAEILLSLFAGDTDLEVRKLRQMEEANVRDDEVSDLLDILIGTNREKVSLATVPAVNHPNVRGRKGYFSRSGHEVSERYAMALRKSRCPIRKAEGDIRLRKEDTAIIIGSRLANTYAEKYLGVAHRSPEKVHVIQDASGARARPQWTFYSDPKAPSVAVVQWGQEWLSRNNLIVECGGSGRTFSAPERLHQASGKKYREDDYLLVSVVPRYTVNDAQRMVIFEGLHRNGTRAAGLLCSRPRIEDLRKLAQEVGADPYWQALFKVKNQVREDGEADPCNVELVEHPSNPFPLEFSRRA